MDLLKNGGYDVKEEAAWAISNATSRGTPARIKFLVQQGCIRALCDLLADERSRLVGAALDGLESILKVGALKQREHWSRLSAATNQRAADVKAAEGLAKIEALQGHQSASVRKKAVRLVETYFPDGSGCSAGGSDAVCKPLPPRRVPSLRS